MMKFENIWNDFNWIIAELESGMAFFEGFIPEIRISNIEPCLDNIAKQNVLNINCEPCWLNDQNIPTQELDYSIRQCAQLFSEGKLASFDFSYRKEFGTGSIHQKLMFFPDVYGAELTIICFADGILSGNNPKEAIELSVKDMRGILKLLQAKKLYIGPDGLDISIGNCIRID